MPAKILRDRKEERMTLVSQSVRSEILQQSSLRVVWSQERKHRAVKTMTRWVSIFGSCEWFSQSSRDSREHTQNAKKCQLHLPVFCSSKSVFVCFSFPSSVCFVCLFVLGFFYNLWNSHTTGSEKKQRGPRH